VVFMPTCSRRQALGALAAAALRRPVFAANDPWAALPAILQRIQAPKFPSRDFNVTRFGAKPDGKTDSSEAFRRAIGEANRAGGGRVVVPEGVFLTGAIHLKSNVNLHVAKGATIRFSPDPKQYPNVLTRFEGMECMNYSPFVYAFEQRNIAVTGAGTLDGQATCDNWWPWGGKRRCAAEPSDQRKARAALMDMVEKSVPVDQRVFGDG
jgi:polygalacturonase